MMPTQQFGRYKILRKLGRSMTDVYLAADPETNQPVRGLPSFETAKHW